MAPMSSLFDFRDASFKGDPKWHKTSPRFARWAPYVVLVLAVLAIIEVVIGVVWIIGIQSLANGWGDLTFAQVIQPLVVPALSFFNTIPSLHLHVLARSNHPLMALIFSSILGTLFFASAVVFIPPCLHPHRPSYYEDPANTIGGYERTECPSGNNRGLWVAMIVFQFFSALLYGLHAAMAVRVMTGVRRKETAIRNGSLVEMVDPEEKARREEEARRRWREMTAPLAG